jgi:hypothetical protein
VDRCARVVECTASDVLQGKGARVGGQVRRCEWAHCWGPSQFCRVWVSAEGSRGLPYWEGILSTLIITQGAITQGAIFLANSFHAVPKKDTFPVRKVPQRKPVRGNFEGYCPTPGSVPTVLVRLPACAPSPVARCSAVRSSTRAHLYTVDPLAYCPSSAAPRHVFPWVSTTLLMRVFAHLSAAGARPFASPGVRAEIMPSSFTHVHLFPGFPHSTWQNFQ